MTDATMDPSIAAVDGLLELATSGRPDLLEFQIHVLLNSAMSFAVHRLAADFGVAIEEVGRTLLQACRNLDKLEKRRAPWRDPAQVLQSPNVAALCHLCRQRVHRVPDITRHRRLEVISIKLERAYGLARSRAWIEQFIGPPLGV